MCNVCPLVLYYTKLANTTQNIIVGLFELIFTIIWGILNCIYKTLVLLCDLIQRVAYYINEKMNNTCPKPQCTVQYCEIMFTISCLLLIVVAIFMIIFHTQCIDTLLGKYDSTLKGLKGLEGFKGDTNTVKNATGTNSTTFRPPTMPYAPPIEQGGLRSGQLDEFTFNILPDQESLRARDREELREIHNDQNIALKPELFPKLVDDAYFKQLQESTVSTYANPYTNSFNDVKELVKEKQSMSKVLSLLEEILTNINSKKKDRNTRLSKLLIRDTYFDSGMEQEEK